MGTFGAGAAHGIAGGILNHCGALVRRCLHSLSRGSGNSRDGERRSSSPRLVFLDFDHTLTVVHVFKALAGWLDEGADLLGACGAVAKPHAITERGQLRRLSELGPAWGEQAFGGSARIEELRALLAHLTGPLRCRLILITRGYMAVVRKCLQDVGLLSYFSEVYANVGTAYGRGTAFDHASEELPPALEGLLGEECEGQWVSKASVVIAHKISAGLSGMEVVLVDDDFEEIWELKDCVGTVHVRGPSGLAVADVRELLTFLGLQPDCAWVQACLQRWAALPDALASRPPIIVTMNRSHLPMSLIFALLRQHVSALESELDACPNAVRRIKLLLREPLLLLSIAQRELARHAQRGEGATFSLQRNLRPLVQCMHAEAGLSAESAIFVGEAAPLARYFDRFSPSSFRRGWSAGTEVSGDGFMFFRSVSPGSDAEGAGETMSRQTSVTHSPSQKLYRAPAASLTDPARALRSALVAFQKDLLGLCPITISKAGVRRNVFGTHHTNARAELAVWSRYEIVEKLGAGHFGEVYRARELCSGREVAVKQLERLEQPNEREGKEETIGDEVSTLRSLAHPNLLRVYEVVKGTDDICIVTELAGGGTLSSFSRQRGAVEGGVKERDQAWVPGAMQQITCAVVYCHRFNVLHGDLKPENVLVHGLRPDGSPLCIVCDFGHTAICVGARTPVAAPGDPRYVSPEVMTEEGLSPKSDIWMLGVTAYELLTGGWLPFFNQHSMTLHASYYQLKFGDARERILSPDGLGWRELERLQGASDVAVAAVRSMLSRYEADRPTAAELLRSEWLLGAQGPCKAAYDEMLGGGDTKSGWGLWTPNNPHFAARLATRAARMEQTTTYGLLLGLLGSGFEETKVRGVRLLFRRMDDDGSGTVNREKFYAAAKRAKLPLDIARRIFDVGSWIHERSFLDFKNLVTVLLDVEDLSDADLERELRSVLNRVRGPHFDCAGVGDAAVVGDVGCAESAAAREQRAIFPSMSIETLVSTFACQGDVRIQRFVEDTRQCLADLHGGRSGEVTPAVLRAMIRGDVAASPGRGKSARSPTQRRGFFGKTLAYVGCP